MKSFKELFTIADKDNTNKEVIEEKVTWNHAEVAIQDVFNDLKSSGYNVKKSGNNGLKIIHDNGCVGTVVFDPTLKESDINELEESVTVKVGDGVFSKNDTEINGRVRKINGSKVTVVMYDDEDSKEFEVPLRDFKHPMQDGKDVTWDFPNHYFRF